uniref:Uncharacterized protein n=1 Tax=Strongyloides papillosus TaxID=174720 RepID=A0A0N5CIV0_STREA
MTDYVCENQVQVSHCSSLQQNKFCDIEHHFLSGSATAVNDISSFSLRNLFDPFTQSNKTLTSDNTLNFNAAKHLNICENEEYFQNVIDPSVPDPNDLSNSPLPDNSLVQLETLPGETSSNPTLFPKHTPSVTATYSSTSHNPTFRYFKPSHKRFFPQNNDHFIIFQTYLLNLNNSIKFLLFNCFFVLNII